MTTACWVTGADGFIGHHLSASLIDKGHQICALGHRDKQRQSDQLAWHDWEVGEISIESLDALASRQTLPDTIFHLAGGGSVGNSFSNPWVDFRSTVISVAAVIEWLRTRSPSTRLIFVSSAAVYGSGHQGRIAENDEGIPFSPYGTHKKVAEKLCSAAVTNFDLDAVIVRPFSIYGPGIRKQLLWDCCTKLSANPDELTMGGTGEEKRDWLHVSDLTAILMRLADPEIAPGSIFNAGTGQGHSVRQIVSMLANAFGKFDTSIKFSNESRAGDPVSLVADIGTMNNLGVKNTMKVDEGIAEYVRWFRSL